MSVTIPFLLWCDQEEDGKVIEELAKEVVQQYKLGEGFIVTGVLEERNVGKKLMSIGYGNCG